MGKGELEPYQRRVVVEREVLDERIGKLEWFFRTQAFKEVDALERERLARQLVHMKAYSGVLWERIEAFGGDPGPELGSAA